MKHFNSFLFAALLLALASAGCTDKVATEAERPGEWTCATLIPEDYESLERDGRPPDPTRGVAARTLLWPLGSTVTVGFIGGTQTERDSVRRAYAEISQYANLNFSITDAPSPRQNIMVGFANSGAWSQIGINALGVQSGQTVNYPTWARTQRGTYVHEALHSVGVLHELQHPDGPCLDTAVVLEYYQRTQGWSIPQIYWNVLTRHERSNVIYTTFDLVSVMSYGAPAAHTCLKVGLPRGTVMSKGDRDLLKKIYPGRGEPPIDPPGTNITLTQAQIDAYWTFDATVVTAQQRAVSAEATAVQLRRQADDLAGQGRARLRTLLKK